MFLSQKSEDIVQLIKHIGYFYNLFIFFKEKQHFLYISLVLLY